MNTMVRDYKDIGVDFTHQGVHFKFLNGDILLPDRYGGFVISPGCGSGKTTAIKDLIRQKYSRGILYSASTIEECNLMYQFCKELVLELNNPTELKLEDIIVLHSNSNDEGVTNEWRNNHGLLCDKKIIICTHHKLLNEYLPDLTRVSFNRFITDKKRSTLQRRSFSSSTSSIIDLPRQYILIDEVPTLKSIEYKITPESIKLMAHRNISYKNDIDIMTGRTELVADKIDYVKPFSYSEFQTNSDLVYRMLPINTKSTEQSKEGIKDIVSSSIYENMNELLKLEDGEERTITYSIADFITPKDFDTHMYVFDGTGDITFGKTSEEVAREFAEGTQKFLTYSIGLKKYNSPVNIEKFNLELTRKLSIEDLIKGEKLESTINTLESIIKSNKRTLIITWKNLKGTRDFDIKDDSLLSSEVNENARLTRVYESELYRRGLTPDQFSIIHYQSGRDKATNDYMDHDAIVFLGEFRVPNYVVSEFNSSYRCNCTPLRYQMYQVIQSICRTRIRLHKKLPINVYFSNDWSDKLLSAVKLYLTGEKSAVDIDLMNKTDSLPLIATSIETRLKPRYKEYVLKLMESYQELDSRITDSLNGLVINPIGFRIPLDDLNKLLGLNHGQLSKYNGLCKYLSTLGVEMTILTKYNK